MVAWMGAEDDPTADPDGAPTRSVPRTAGPLLAPRLGSTAANIGAGLRRRGAGSGRGELSGNDLMHQRNVDVAAEQLLRQGAVAGGLPAPIEHLRFSRRHQLAFL
jgi:hypothetical protein